MVQCFQSSSNLPTLHRIGLCPEPREQNNHAYITISRSGAYLDIRRTQKRRELIIAHVMAAQVDKIDLYEDLDELFSSTRSVGEFTLSYVEVSVSLCVLVL